MRLRTLLSPALLSLCSLVNAQSATRVNKLFDKDHFADAEGLKTALTAMKKGDALFQSGGTHFTQALEEYEKAHAFNPNNAELDLKMGLCHLNGRYHHRSLPYFQAAYELDNLIPRIHFLLGMAHQLNAHWNEAIAEYQKLSQDAAAPANLRQRAAGLSEFLRANPPTGAPAASPPPTPNAGAPQAQGTKPK